MPKEYHKYKQTFCFKRKDVAGLKNIIDMINAEKEVNITIEHGGFSVTLSLDDVWATESPGHYIINCDGDGDNCIVLDKNPWAVTDVSDNCKEYELSYEDGTTIVISFPLSANI